MSQRSAAFSADACSFEGAHFLLTQHVLLSRRHAELTQSERDILRRAIAEVRVYEARRTLVHQGDPVNTSILLLDGLMSRHVDDLDGARQLVAVQIAGDFVDLHGYPLKTLDHDVSTLTDVRVALVPHAELERIQIEHPLLARKLWFLTLLDAAMHRKWIFRLGRLRATARVAHFLCETNTRLFVVGLSDGRRFGLPLTQFDLGEICGLTSVHVNRVMRELRDCGLVTFRSSWVEIHDLAGLAHLGEFDPGYLYLNAEVSGAMQGIDQ